MKTAEDYARAAAIKFGWAREEHAELALAVLIAAAMTESRAQGRREGLEEALCAIATVYDTAQECWGRDAANVVNRARDAIRALLDAPPTVADPLDAVAEVRAWRGLSEPQRKHAIEAFYLGGAASAYADVRTMDTAIALLRRLSPPPVASKETP